MPDLDCGLRGRANRSLERLASMGGTGGVAGAYFQRRWEGCTGAGAALPSPELSLDDGGDDVNNGHVFRNFHS